MSSEARSGSSSEESDGPIAGASDWDRHADWWLREFTEGADPEYVEQIEPLALRLLAGCRRVVDVGTGDGQLARALARRGVDVVGVDPTWACVEAAASRSSAGGVAGAAGTVGVASADAGALPFSDASFDGALVSLVFEHVDEFEEALAEIARVLEPGGTFAFLLNHPILQAPGSVWVEDHLVDPPESYWRLGPYLVESDVEEQVQPGVWIRFLHRPLSRYVNAMSRVGLVIDEMVEPVPPAGFRAQAPGYEASAAFPRLLALRCRRRER
ncbi:MAG: class I SAM-dependent methyltransferase [Actinomycetota bacterium]